MAVPLTGRRLIGFLAAAMALLALVACSPAAPAATPTKAPAASTPAGSTAPAPTQPPATKAPAASTPTSAPTAAPKALTKVAVGSVDFFINRHALPYYVGMSKGFFAAEGLQVEMVTMASAGDALRAIDAGQIVYLATGVGGAANAILQGGKARIVGGVLGAAATAGYLVKLDSPIKSYKDIKGKTLAFASPGGYMHWVALAAVKAAGLTTNDVKLLPAGGSPEAWAAVQGGAADAAWAIDGGGSQMVIDGKARWAFKDADILPDFQSTALYTSQKEMTDRPDQLKAFLRAYQKSAEYVQANIDEALRAWTAYPSVAQAGITYDNAKKIMDIYPLPLQAVTTKLSVAGLKVNGDLMLETGVVKEKVDWSKIIDQSFLAPALQVDLSKIQ